MNLLTLALAGAAAIQPALSFLLVPTIPKVEGASPDLLLPSADAINANLKCSQCPFPVQEGNEVNLGDGVDSVLSLNLSTSRGRLLLNGMPVFPRPEPHHLPILTASLRRLSDDVETPTLPFGYVFEILPTATDKHHDSSTDRLFTFRFTVVDLEGVPINVQPIEMRVISTGAPHHEELVFAHIEIQPNMPDESEKYGWRACNGSPACYHRLLVERLHAMFQAAKTRAHELAGGLRGCMGKFQDKIGALMSGMADKHHNHHQHDDDNGKPHEEDTVHTQNTTQGMSPSERYDLDNFMRNLHHASAKFLVVFLGVFIYVAAVCGIIMTFRRFCCCGVQRRGPDEAGDEEERAGLVSEDDLDAAKEVYVHEGEAPPEYEEAEPLKEVYVEVNEKQ